MERFNVIKDISIQLGLTQVQGSWVKTLGQYLGVVEEPGGDDYEQRVFTAAISNSEPGIGTNIGNSNLVITNPGVERKLTFADDTLTDQFNIKDINGNSVLMVQGTGQLSLGNSVGISTTTKVELNNTDRVYGLNVIQNVSSGSNITYGVNINNFGGVGHTGQIYGIRARAYGNTTAPIYGGSFIAQGGSGNSESNGLAASASGGTTLNIGLLVVASGTGSYLGRFIDGTQGLGKVITCVNADGRANWNKVTSTYTTGASGTYSTVDGKLVTVTNGLITSIV